MKLTKEAIQYGNNITTHLEGFLPNEIVQGKNDIQISVPKQVSVTKTLDSLFSTSKDSWLAKLHKDMCNETHHIKIPDNTTHITSPVMIQKTMRDKSFFENVFIEVGKNCNVFILETLNGSGAYHSGRVEILLGEGSTLQLASVQNLSQETNTFTLKNAILQKNAGLEWVSLDTGGKVVLSQIRSTMKGSGSQVNTKLMTYGTGSQQFDYDVSSLHSAPDTASNILQKAVLDNRARMVINGLVKVAKSAPRSSGFQKEDTLLLSPEAEAAPIPNLEINSHDVKCSHGTTVGQIDRDMLFYLMSRGLSEKEATKTVVRGFFTPLVSSLPLQCLQTDLYNIVNQKLEEME